MVSSLTLKTAPTKDAVTVAEAKTHLRILDTNDDTKIGLIVSEATRWAEGMMGKAIISQTWTWRADAFPGVIYLDMPPLNSVTHVKYYDTAGVLQTLTAVTDYQTDIYSTPGRIAPAYGTSWPSTKGIFNAVEVEFICGMASSEVNLALIPDGKHIREQVLKVVAFSYENRGEGTLLKIPEDAEKAILSHKWSWG